MNIMERRMLLQLDNDLFDLLGQQSEAHGLSPTDYARMVLAGTLLGSEITTRLAKMSAKEASEEAMAALLTPVMEGLRSAGGAESQAPVLPPGPADCEVEIFSREVFNRILEHTAPGLNLSLEKTQEILASLVGKGPYRPLAPIPAPEAFDLLQKSFPNFSPVAEKIQNIARIARLTGNTSPKIRPILLAGPPGIGKTAFLKSLAAVLQVPITFLDCSVMTAGSALTGLSFTWKNGSSGPIMRSVCLGSVANPVFVLDEIDKTGKMREYANIHDVLHGVLEPLTAESLVDESLGADYPFNASHVTWIATCNTLSEIPKSLLSRFLVFEIEGPSERDMVNSVVPSIMQGILSENSLESYLAPLSGEALEKLGKFSPREVRQVLESAVEKAVTRRVEKDPDNREPIPLALEDLVLPERKNGRFPLGFTPEIWK